MAARAIWKGNLRLGKLQVPVKLYSALTDRSVHFNMLETKTRSRVTQEMVNTQGKPVSRGDIRKAYEVERGSFVVLTEKELAGLEPKDSRDIALDRFVAINEINHQWYDRPYWMGPDGDELAYFAFVRALSEANKQGVVRWVMRDQEYVGVVRSTDGYLMLITLRFAEEVLDAADLVLPPGRDLDKRELGMAAQLVNALRSEFDPQEFQDEYRERVLHFLKAKASGRKPRLQVVHAKRETTSLHDALAKSLSHAKEKKAA